MAEMGDPGRSCQQEEASLRGFQEGTVNHTQDSKILEPRVRGGHMLRIPPNAAVSVTDTREGKTQSLGGELHPQFQMGTLGSIWITNVAARKRLRAEISSNL